MKVLFLDIDGILNNRDTKKRFLNWAEGKDISIVISSTWRTDFRSLTELTDNGVDYIDVTPKIGCERGFEVNAWIAEHKPDAYAIIDDVDEFLPDQRSKLVLTDPVVGVTDDDLKQIEEILGLT